MSQPISVTVSCDKIVEFTDIICTDEGPDSRNAQEKSVDNGATTPNNKTANHQTGNRTTTQSVDHLMWC